MIKDTNSQDELVKQINDHADIRFLSEDPIWDGMRKCDDPYGFATSMNVHRRHLSTEQKRDLITKLLKANPGRSDREIGRTVKADGKTVATVRQDLEARAEIPHVETRKDSKGRAQPARKPKAEPAETAPGHCPCPLCDDAEHADSMPATKAAKPQPDQFDAFVFRIETAVDEVMDQVPAAEWPHLFVDLQNMLNELLNARLGGGAKAAAASDPIDLPDFLRRPAPQA
jgi:hypothetical protein